MRKCVHFGPRAKVVKMVRVCSFFDHKSCIAVINLLVALLANQARLVDNHGPGFNNMKIENV